MMPFEVVLDRLYFEPEILLHELIVVNAFDCLPHKYDTFSVLSLKLWL